MRSLECIFNPVPIMELLELVKHDLCSSETIDFAQKAGAEMGKTTILVNDIPGFATSRLGVVLGNEAIRMLADGVANAEDIDKGNDTRISSTQWDHYD